MRNKLIGLILISAGALPAWGQTLQPVTTRAFDNSRSGANTHETILTRDNVVAKGIRRVTIIPVFGDARGTESQPLILPGVKLKDGSTHDVMILPSMANIVHGVDAETGAALWQTSLGRPINGGVAIDMHQINDHWGVEYRRHRPDTKRVYLVAWISPHVCVLDIADGALVVPPVSLVNAKSGTQRFASAMRKQRSSLVMTNGMEWTGLPSEL
jgi:hypothetical protein